MEIDGPLQVRDPVATVLDPRFLSTPSVALERARTVVLQMGELAKNNYHLAVELLSHYDQKQLDLLNEQEEALDHMESSLWTNIWSSSPATP